MNQGNLLKKLSKEDLDDSNAINSDYLKGCLYIIATPIGNFDDITIRAIKLLNFVDILLCEDTRKTSKLLSAHGVKNKTLISYNDHNASKKRPYVINQLLLDKSIGLVSDAGTPLISDPGYKLVQECYLKNIIVTHSPGPSSVINALVLSNLPSDQFYFGGFIPSNKSGKEKKFLLTKYNQMTGIWFDTCIRLPKTLKVMLNIYGNRKISIMRELTKTHEDVILSDLENIENILLKRKESNIPLLGEIVVVISGYQLNSDLDIDIIKDNIKEKLSSFSLRDTVNMIVSETGLSKKIIYEEAIKINNENINTKK